MQIVSQPIDSKGFIDDSWDGSFLIVDEELTAEESDELIFDFAHSSQPSEFE